MSSLGPFSWSRAALQRPTDFCNVDWFILKENLTNNENLDMYNKKKHRNWKNRLWNIEIEKKLAYLKEIYIYKSTRYRVRFKVYLKFTSSCRGRFEVYMKFISNVSRLFWNFQDGSLNQVCWGRFEVYFNITSRLKYVFHKKEKINSVLRVS